MTKQDEAVKTSIDLHRQALNYAKDRLDDAKRAYGGGGDFMEMSRWDDVMKSHRKAADDLETSRRPVIEEIAVERNRQIEKEGFDARHDEEHCCGELALVAALYASPVLLLQEDRRADSVVFYDPWPQYWAEHWDKRPKDGNVTLPNDCHPPEKRRRQLIIAAALIVAEIERVDRETPK